MIFLSHRTVVKRILIGLSLVAVVTTVQAGDHWPEWRGENGQGHGSAVGVPWQWSEDANITWKTEIPGLGWSTPVIANGRIWVTTAIDVRASKDEAARLRKTSTNSQPLIISTHVSLRAVCVDLRSGSILKNIEVFSKENPQFIQIDNSYASPSPILDGDRLYCHFGPNGMAAVDTRSSEVLWMNKSFQVKHENGPGSSPILWNDLLIVHCDGIDQQYIVAVDKNTGDVVWKTTRSGAMNENPQLRKSYATPLIVKVDGQEQLLSTAADWLYGYDPKTGRELWKLKFGLLGFSNSSRPVAGHGLVYICTGFMKSQLLAVRPGTADRPAEVAWTYTKQVPAVSSPLLVGDELYFASGKGIATCLNAKTGAPHWTERIGKSYWASPMFADGRIYFFDKDGTTTVIGPGTDFQSMATNSLTGKIQAAAAAVDNALILRTDKALYRAGRD